jgi:hypothetical protein
MRWYSGRDSKVVARPLITACGYGGDRVFYSGLQPCSHDLAGKGKRRLGKTPKRVPTMNANTELCSSTDFLFERLSPGTLASQNAASSV